MATSTTTYAYDDQRNVIAVGLPDPDTGAAAALATDPAVCAVRNICYTYDDRGNRTTAIQAWEEDGHLLVRTSATEYNEYNRPIREVDPTGTVTTFTYDAYGNVMTLADNSQWGIMGGYTYDPDDRGNPRTRYLGNDPSRATTYMYDQYGNVATETDPLGNRITYADYDIFGNPGTMTLELDDGFGTPITQVYDYDYNDLGQMTRTTLDDGSGTTSTTRSAYDQRGRLVDLHDETTGWHTSSDYYQDGAVKQVTATDGSAVFYTYTWRGEIATMTDAAGVVTRYTYDLAGNQTGRTTAVGAANEVTTTHSYDLAGRETGTTDARGHTTVTRYDDLDRPLQVEDPVHGATHPTVFAYNDAGRLEGVLGVDGILTHYQYDARGFPEAITANYVAGQANPLVEYQQHDGIGNVTQVTDRAGNTTTYGYDAADRLVWVKNPLQEETSYRYDGFGNVRQIQDAAGHRTTFAYDGLGRVTRKTWHDGTAETFTYTYVERGDSNPAHDQTPTGADPTQVYLRVAHHLADGNINYTYTDWRGHLDRVTSYDGTIVQYRYTDTGQVASVTDQQGTTCYVYNARTRLTDIRHIGPATDCATAAVLRTLTYTYDANDNRTSMTATVGTTSQTVGYAYDALNRLCAVGLGRIPDSCTDPTADYTYTYEDYVADPAIARRTTLTYPNEHVVQTMTYDPLYRLTELTQQDGAGTILAQYAATYDPTGKRQSLNETVAGVTATTTWAYDAADRLVREQRAMDGIPLWDRSFTYDRVGNRQTMQEAVAGIQTTYTYHPNGLDQLATVQTTGPGGTTTQAYTYDARGNLTSDGTRSYQYDAADRLTAVTAGGSPVATYVYDAAGRRARQTVGTTTTTFLWDEASAYGDVVAEIDGSGAVDTRYVLAAGTLLAQERGGRTHYLLGDMQGSTRLLATSGGTIAASYQYDAFGNLQHGPATPETSYLYTGQQFDVATGLYALRARYYNPADGRFLSRDPYPVDLQHPVELNRYVYVANNPVNLVDPSGLTGIVGQGAMHADDAETSRDHANYRNGLTPACENSTLCFSLSLVAIASYVTDKVIIATINSLLPNWARRAFTIGLGTVLHLHPTDPIDQTKVFAITDSPCAPGAVERATDIPFDMFFDMLAGMLINIEHQAGARIGGIEVHLIFDYNGANNPFDTWFRNNTHAYHAEMLIARWSLEEYGGYPTPYRLLDIVTTIEACAEVDRRGRQTRWGQNACNNRLPEIRSRHPLLFEMTILGGLR